MAAVGSITGMFARNPRRAWFLTLLIAVLGALWGRLIFNGPHFIDASTDHVQPITSTSQALSGNPQRRSEPAVSLVDWARKPGAQPLRNLFAVPYDQYPIDPAHPPQSAQKSGSEAKSTSAQADQIRERQKLVDRVRAEAAHLTLEGTILGEHPRVWFNGLLVGVGDMIGSSGFRVVKIDSRRVVIERDGVRVEISMK